MTSVSENQPAPRGALCLQTIAMPGDANPNGDIFGGWLVSQMDLAAAIEQEAQAQALLLRAHDHREFYMAWKEKREPRFLGR